MPRSHCTFSITPIKICLSASQNSKSVIFSSAIIWSRKRPCAAVTLAAIVYYINLLLLLSYEMRFLVEKRSVHLGHAPAIRLMKYMRLLITNVNRRRREAKALARSPGVVGGRLQSQLTKTRGTGKAIHLTALDDICTR